jgi:hypothetical protein
MDEMASFFLLANSITRLVGNISVSSSNASTTSTM